MFKCKKGELNENNKKTADKIKNWILKKYKNDLKKRPSVHDYISKLPKNIINDINKIRYSKQIINDICKQFKKCNLIPLDSIDEIYISHYNLDNGGDQGLFEKHYDGNLRLLNNFTTIRALIYLSSSGSLKVNFYDCKKKYNFKTYDYGLLDFHRELHKVEGKYDSKEIPRILLKCNYLICENCSSYYSYLITKINLYIFYIVKLSMEYSKSPKTCFQKIIGFFCNFFRKINTISPLLSSFFAIFIILMIILFIFYLFKYVYNIKKKNKK